jgi:hypothetical protein
MEIRFVGVDDRWVHPCTSVLAARRSFEIRQRGFDQQRLIVRGDHHSSGSFDGIWISDGNAVSLRAGQETDTLVLGH